MQYPHKEIAYNGIYSDSNYGSKKVGGRVLIHHSNYDKGYKASFINSPHGCSYMNAGIFAYLVFRCGFRFLEQRVISWAGMEGLDCVSLLEK